LRKDYSDERPAQPVLYLDGTGGPLNNGICHGTMGCADFAAVGSTDAKQSVTNLQSTFLYTGDDHAASLRNNTALAFESYNCLVGLGSFSCQIEREEGVTTMETIPCRPMIAADMQGAKSDYGMSASSHSVWCLCQSGDGGSHHAYSTIEVSSYEQILEYCDKIGCVIKTEDQMCCWAHYSPGAARGGAFTRFECSCCSYAPSEKKWRADLAAWHTMDDAGQAAAKKKHMDVGNDGNSHKQHYHQELFTPPLPHHGMDRCGVDNLHLLYMNTFKHLFKYTVHEGLTPAKKKVLRAYFKKAGFYSYDAAADDEDPTKHWIGREVKRFLVQAAAHLLFLLQLASAPAECIAEMAECTNEEGEQEMDDDDEYEPTAEEVAQEEAEVPIMMQNAARWDRFLRLVRMLQAPWPQGDADTDEYRKSRAVELFNSASVVCRDLLELKLTMRIWVPHILLFIVPRQMLYLGDPTRRSCDACASFGAMMKKIIQHSTCRRRIDGDQVTRSPKTKLNHPVTHLPPRTRRCQRTTARPRGRGPASGGGRLSIGATSSRRSGGRACARKSGTVRRTGPSCSASTQSGQRRERRARTRSRWTTAPQRPPSQPGRRSWSMRRGRRGLKSEILDFWCFWCFFCKY